MMVSPTIALMFEGWNINNPGPPTMTRWSMGVGEGLEVELLVVLGVKVAVTVAVTVTTATLAGDVGLIVATVTLVEAVEVGIPKGGSEAD